MYSVFMSGTNTGIQYSVIMQFTVIFNYSVFRVFGIHVFICQLDREVRRISSVGGNLEKWSLGGKLERTSAGKQNLEDGLQEVLGRTPEGGELEMTSVG